MRWPIVILVGVLAVVAVASGLRGSLINAQAPVAAHDIDLARPFVTSPDPREPLRIAVLGTSLSHEYTWPEAVARDLEQRLARNVRLVLHAKSGATSDWGRATAASDAALAGADVVLFEFLANDADILELMTVRQSRRNHQAMIDSIRNRSGRSHQPAIVLMTMNPVHGVRGYLRQRAPSFAAMYTNLARETGVGLLDLTSRWDPRERFRDGLHPTNAQANAVIPSAVVSYLLRAGLR